MRFSSGGAVQEFTEAGGPTQTAGSTVEHLTSNASRAPRATAVRRKRFGRWEKVTFEQFHDDVRQLAKGLAAAGVQPGDRIGIMSAPRYEWTLADYAIWYAGAVGVPVAETSSAEQLEWVLSDSGAVWVFLEGALHRAVFDQVAGHLPHVRVWVFDEDAVEHLQQAGAVVGDDDIDARRDTLTQDSVATIVYTSGTTGPPKGCVLTHGNLVFAAESLVRAMPELFTPSACALALLPLSDIFGRAAQVACVYAGVQLGHGRDTGDLADYRPTVLLTTPSVLEEIYDSIVGQVGDAGRGRMFALAASTAVDYSRSIDAGGPGAALRLRHEVFDRMLFGGIRGWLGGGLTHAVSCGAALGEQLVHFYRGIGITVLEGYGLTETTAAATVNRPRAVRIGSVGRPIPGTSVRIASDGEVMVRGRHVFRDYWNNSAAAANVLSDDGWLRTGDLGAFDDQGFLRISGRTSDLIVTSTGRRIVPAALEERLRTHALISQAVVVGEGRPYLAAIVTIDRQALASWLTAAGRSAVDPGGLTDDPQVRAAVADAVDDANRSVAKAESIRRFAILDGDWTVAAGQLTPSLKLKRDVVLRQCAEQIESLYA